MGEHSRPFVTLAQRQPEDRLSPCVCDVLDQPKASAPLRRRRKFPREGPPERSRGEITCEGLESRTKAEAIDQDREIVRGQDLGGFDHAATPGNVTTSAGPCELEPAFAQLHESLGIADTRVVGSWKRVVAGVEGGSRKFYR